MSVCDNPFLYEFAELAKLARHLLAKREAGYTKLIIDGKMTKEEATDRIHNMEGAAQLMHAMIGFSEIGELPAQRRAIHKDLTDAATKARKMADERPQSEAHEDTAWGLEAMAYWLAPFRKQFPFSNKSKAEFIHEANIALHARADQERAKAA